MRRRRVLVSHQDGEPVVKVKSPFVALEEGAVIVEQCFSGIMNNDKTIAILYGQSTSTYLIRIHIRLRACFLMIMLVIFIQYPMFGIIRPRWSENFPVTTFQYTFLST